MESDVVFQVSSAARVVEMTLGEPSGEATHWTGRAMAKAAGISLRSVQRIWAAHGLKPHRLETFKLSRDPNFVAKMHDIIGLYLDPPEHALVLAVDGKSQIQALDRTQPGLPMKKGRSGAGGAPHPTPCMRPRLSRMRRVASGVPSWKVSNHLSHGISVLP